MVKPETIFKICNSIVLSPWLLMIVAPNWNYTKIVIESFIFPILLSVVYIFYRLISIGKSSGDFFSLAGVERLFRNRHALLAGWVHYLVFDLFVGSWELADAQKHNISHWFLAPCLVLTFIFGPFGFLIYILIRSLVFGIGLF